MTSIISLLQTAYGNILNYQRVRKSKWGKKVLESKPQAFCYGNKNKNKNILI